jgi:hypothetical protein
MEKMNDQDFGIALKLVSYRINYILLGYQRDAKRVSGVNSHQEVVKDKRYN